MDLDIVLPQWRQLQAASRDVRDRAWAPYSKFHVGAAVLTKDGHIFVGCNVENASYGLTICAERVAICSAVAQGHSEFAAICVSLSDSPVPCGACRQFLVEFNPRMLVLLDDVNRPEIQRPEIVRLTELLPRAFRL
jgi:cytidine deaminase